MIGRSFIVPMREMCTESFVEFLTNKIIFAMPKPNYVSTINSKIVLIDGQRLAELMIDFGIGVTEVTSYSVKRIDSDYFTN